MKKTLVALALTIVAIVSWRSVQSFGRISKNFTAVGPHGESTERAAVAKDNKGLVATQAVPSSSKSDGTTIDQGLLDSRSGAMPAEKQIETHLRALLQQTKHPVNLSEDEFNKFASVMVDMLKVNGALKANAAKVQTDVSGKIEIKIPSRPEEAEEMQQMLKEQLRARLSAQRSAEIESALSEQLMTYFWGYGAGDEVYVLTPSTTTNGKYDYEFSSDIPAEFPRDKFSYIGKRFAGTSEGGTLSLNDLYSNPQYAFLSLVLNTPKS